MSRRRRHVLLGSGLVQKETDNAASATTLAKRTDKRIKLILLVMREDSQQFRLHLHFDRDGEILRPIPNDFEVTFSTGAALAAAFVFGPFHQPYHLLDEFQWKSVCFGDVLRRLIPFHVRFEYWIENLIRRQ